MNDVVKNVLIFSGGAIIGCIFGFFVVALLNINKG